jgi:hypothetical protein
MTQIKSALSAGYSFLFYSQRLDNLFKIDGEISMKRMSKTLYLILGRKTTLINLGVICEDIDNGNKNALLNLLPEEKLELSVNTHNSKKLLLRTTLKK